MDEMLPFLDMKANPANVSWRSDPIPPVETVPYDRALIVWSPEYLGYVMPWGNEMNPLRWCDHSRMPSWGDKSPSGWWTIARPGSLPRPPRIQTWPHFIASMEGTCFRLPDKARCQCSHEWSLVPLVAETGFYKRSPTHPLGFSDELETVTYNAGDLLTWSLSVKCPLCGAIFEASEEVQTAREGGI